MSSQEIKQEIQRLENLLASLCPNSQNEPPPVRKVIPWRYGARVVFEDDTFELVSIAPKIGRFPVGVYNKIVELVNLNSQALSP